MKRFVVRLILFLVLVSPAMAYNGRGFAGGFIQAAVVEVLERLNIPHGDAYPTTGQAEGDIFWRTDTEILAVWNGSSWVPVTGGGSYNDEQAQDAVGTILVDSATIDFTYNDGTPSITASVIGGSGGDCFSDPNCVYTDGRAGGQTIIGGTADSENLTLIANTPGLDDPGDVIVDARQLLVNEIGPYTESFLSIFGVKFNYADIRLEESPGTIEAIGTIQSDSGFRASSVSSSSFLTDGVMTRDTASPTTFNFNNPTSTLTLQVEGNTVWHAGNDGTGSTLDADLLDGLDSTAFVTTSTDTELAQDAVGTILTDSSTIDFTYTDATPSIAAAVLPGGITHSSLGGLTTSDAGHTQFALLAGRAGSQVLNGGTAANESLTLASTANATKGEVILIGNTRTAYTFQAPTIYGSSVSGGDITIDSTSDASPGYLRLQSQGGIVGIDETSDSFMTTGFAVNQGSADDEALALKSSDVAHGMTTLAETDTYGYFSKQSATEGGITIIGFSEGTAGLRLVGSHTTDTTTKSTGALGAMFFDGFLKSGTTVTSLGANANILAIRNFSTTRWILDAEGDTWQTGAATLGEVAAPSTPGSGTGVYYVSTTGLPRFINDGGTDVDLSFSAGAYDPELYFGGNVLPFPDPHKADGLQPWGWLEEDANVNVTEEDAIGESIPDKYKRVLKVVGGASGTDKYVYSRTVIADHNTLDTGAVMSCGVWVYQPDAATAKLAVVGSTSGSLGTATTTAVTTWTLLKVVNFTIGGSDTYFDVRYSVNEASDTSWWTMPMCNPGPTLRPFCVNPMIHVIARTANVVNSDPANGNWNTQSYASSTSPQAFMVDIFSLIATTSLATCRSGFWRLTGTSDGQDGASRFVVTNVVTTSEGSNSATVPLDTTQQGDWSVDGSACSLMQISVAGYWQWAN